MRKLHSAQAHRKRTMQEPQRYLTSIAVGLAVGVVVAVVASLVSSADVVSGTDVKVGIGLGLLVTVIALLLDIILRVERRAERQDKASRVLAAIERAPELGDQLSDLAESASAVESRGAPLFRSVAKRTLDEANEDLSELERGFFRTPAGNYTVLIQLTDETKKTIWATTFESETPWWNSSPGRKYWDANRAALNRSPAIAIRRVFIYDEWNGDIDALCKQQAADGVKVERVKRTDLDRDDQLNIVLFDGEIGQRIERTPDGQQVSCLYSAAQVSVERLKAAFERISAQATPYRAADNGKAESAE